MNRRTLLTRAGAAALLQMVTPSCAPSSRAVGAPTVRRVRESDPQWPDASRWERLNRHVGGRLVAVRSPLAECARSLNSAGCAPFLEYARNPYYLGDEVGLTQNLGWVGAWTSQPSVYAVAAENTADVVAGVNFAREHRLRLVVKGGGHSYLGTSCAPDSLLIWTRRMNAVTGHDAFVARGCAGEAPQPAVTLGAGTLWMHGYDEVTTRAGRYVQGGGCTTVGVAGLVQSGGFSSFSKRYGLAAAGLLQAEVVTADGTVRIANACTHPDLFWALKGGGGGTFGVISKMTLKLHDLPASFGVASFKVKAASDAAYRRLIGEFISFYRTHLF